MKPLLTGSTRINRGTDDRLGKSIDVALVGEFVRFWYDYDARMKVLEAQRAASAASRSSQGDRP